MLTLPPTTPLITIFTNRFSAGGQGLGRRIVLRRVRALHRRLRAGANLITFTTAFAPPATQALGNLTREQGTDGSFTDFVPGLVFKTLLFSFFQPRFIPL